MNKQTVAVLLLLVFVPGSLLWADGCGTPQRVVQTYQPYVAPRPAVVVVDKFVEKPVVFTKFVPVLPLALVDLAVFPTYSAQYVPPLQVQPGIPQPAPVQQAPALAQQQGADMTKVMGFLEKINARLDRLEKQPGVPQTSGPPQAPKGEQAPPPKQEQTAASVVMNKCAACHDAKTAGQGGDFVMTKDNKLELVTADQCRKIVRKCHRNEMPPKDNKLQIAPLSDEENSVLVDYYTKASSIKTASEPAKEEISFRRR